MRIRPIYLALAAVSAPLGMLLAAGVLLISQRHTAVAFDCGTTANPELIVQSGSEYLLANPSVSGVTNSYLVTLELKDPSSIPARWRFQEAQVLRADASGLELQIGAGSDREVASFAAASGQWRSRTGNSSPARVTNCRRLAALPASISRLSGVPLSYLQMRPWPLSVLNPDLSAPDFRLAMARELSGRSGSEYSFYKLVSSLSRSLLTPTDEDHLQAARKALEAELSVTTSFWEYSGSSSATWEYPNEQAEAREHANQWCQQQSEGTLASRLAEGYQLISSVPQSRDSGRQRALYPDGRFAGYVDYTANCQGMEHTIRQDADLSRLP